MFIGIAIVVLLSRPASGQGVPTPGGEKSKPPTLEQAIFDLHKAMHSKDKARQEAGLRGILPSKKDIEVLFPRHAEKLWPGVEKGIQHYVANLDKIVADFERRGKVEKVIAYDIRADEAKEAGYYRRLLKIIPDNIPLFRIREITDKGGGSSETYLLVNGRWIWIRELYTVAEYLDKLDVKK
jgi:hypothetical protein